MQSYWDKPRKLPRRQFLATTLAGGVGVAGAGLVGCGDDNSSEPTAGSPTPTTSGSPSSSPTATAQATPKSGGTFRYIDPYADEPRLDPGKLTLNSTESFMLYDTLIEYDASGKFIPGLATSWEPTDQTTLTLKLRSGVQYHDGTQFKAEDVVWNMKRQISFKTAASGDLAQIDSFQTPDDGTVVLKLKQPFSPMIELLTQSGGVMASPSAIGTKSPDDANGSPVGTGPFKLASWTVGSGKTFSKFPGYWRKDRPYLDEVTSTFISEYLTALANLESGSAQSLSSLKAPDVKRLQDQGFRVNPFPNGHYWAMRINMGAAPFTDKRLRQAVARAIDRESIVKTLQPLSPVGEGIFGPGFMPVYDPSFKSSLPYSPSEATKLLSAAGKPDGFEFELLTIPNTPGSTEAQAIGAMLATVGIKVNFWSGDLAAGAKRLYSRDFQATFTANTPMPIAPYFRIDQAFLSDGSRNYENYSNPVVDSTLRASAVSYEPEARIAAYRKIQPIIDDDASTIVVYYGLDTTAYAKTVQNVMDWPGGIEKYTDVWLA